MPINRRDFLKFSAGAGLLAGAGVDSAVAATEKPPQLPKDAVGILYDATLCIGCMACMVNCKRTNAEPGGALYHREAEGQVPYEYPESGDAIYDAPLRLSGKTLCIIKAYRAEGDAVEPDAPHSSFIKQHCLHCIDPPCVSVCPVRALQKQSDTGIVTYNKHRCFGCRYCQVACPFGIPQFEWEKASPSIVKCQLCNHRLAQGKFSACCEFCPTGASIFGPVEELREEAKRRLALKPGDTYNYQVQHVDGRQRTEKVVSRYVDHIYGMDEAGGTQYLFLAGVEFNKLGFNPHISNEIYPRLTWSYISHVPALIGTLLVAGTVTRLVTQRIEKNKDASQKSTDEADAS